MIPVDHRGLLHDQTLTASVRYYSFKLVEPHQYLGDRRARLKNFVKVSIRKGVNPETY